MQQPRSRWTLLSLGQVCGWLSGYSESGICKLLKRLGIHYKRARSYIHSPDPDYTEKLEQVHICLGRYRTDEQSCVVLFEDEMTYYRQPSLAQAYALAGSKQPLAVHSCHKDTPRRVVGTLDAISGRVVWHQAERLGVAALVGFYQRLCQVYAGVSTLYLVEDNWPIHFHPDVLAALEPQRLELPVPVCWPAEPTPKAKRLNLPIQLVPLPTYASWCNPIEKLWRWLKQEVLHLHRYATQWNALQELVGQFLDQFVQGSEALLRYVGLKGADNLFGATLQLVT